MLLRVPAVSARGAATLARVAFGSARGLAAAQDDPLDIVVPLAPLADDGAWCDVFPAGGPVRRDAHGDVAFATDGQRLVGCVELDESRLGGLQSTAQHAYAAIFALLDREACGVPLRFWNYVPRINAVTDGLERYRRFNVGRQEAFLAAHRAAFAGAPAACAIGSHADRLLIYFLAGRDQTLPIENPRQVSAYHYPAEYGPRAPTFSRASVVDGPAPTLFISGTASIVGHRSRHDGDPVAQTVETFVNIRAVIAAANARTGAQFEPGALACTVYVRRPDQLAAIRDVFVRETGAHSAAAANAVFLAADVCRTELLVEIEASATLAARVA